jgi:hypothetical protein
MFTNCVNKCASEKYGLDTCGNCGKGKNYGCNACNLYYSNTGVCGCLKELIKGGPGCVGGKPWKGSGNPPVWTLHKGGKLLISSTVLNTGVESLKSMPEKDAGWELGVKNMQHKTQALAMNSQSQRDEDQVHIHICSKVIAAESVLAGLSYTTLSPVTGKNWPPVPVYCKLSSTPSTDVVNWQLPAGVKISDVGIGLLTDTKGRWWTCASVGGTASYGVFCG